MAMVNQRFAAEQVRETAGGSTCLRCGSKLAGQSQYCALCGTVSGGGITPEIGAAEGGGVVEQPAPANEVDADLQPDRVHLIEQALRINFLLSLLPPTVRQDLGAAGFHRRYRPGEWITHEGSSATRAFIMLSGTAQVLIPVGQDRQILIKTISFPDMFGQPPGILFTKREFSVRAVSPVEVFVLPWDLLKGAAEQWQIFAEAFDSFGQVLTVEAFLRRASPFASLPPALLVDLAGRLTRVSLAEGQELFMHGDQGDAMYVLWSGRVEVEIDGERVATLRVGDCVGEGALLTGEPRSATVRALAFTELLRFDRNDFDRIVREHDEIRLFFIELLRRRDLLTPSVERTNSRATPRVGSLTKPTEETLGRWEQAKHHYAGLLGVSALLAILSLTVIGKYLLFVGLVSALLMAVVSAGYLLRSPLIRNMLSVRRFVLPYALGSAIALSLEYVLMNAQLLGQLPGALQLTTPLLARALLIPLFAALLFMVLEGRRGARLELMDSFLVGGALGFGLGLPRAFWGWLDGIASTSLNDVSVGWGAILFFPVLYALLGALIGASLWKVVSRRSMFYAVEGLVLSTAILLIANAPFNASFAPLISLCLFGFAVLATERLAYRQWELAVTARAAALLTFGLSGVVGANTGSQQVYCWGCGEPAGSQQVYCSRCGQSLVEDEPSLDQTA